MHDYAQGKNIARHLWLTFSAEDGQYLVLQVASSFLNQYTDQRGNENTQLCICFCAGGILLSPETRLYCAYSAYSAYSCYDFSWLLHSLVGCVPVYHCRRVPLIRASLVCYSSFFHTGKAASCSSRQYRDDAVLDAKRSSWLSRRFLQQNKGQQRQLQVVVCEQLGTQLGNKAIMEWGFPKGSVAKLVGAQAFCAMTRVQTSLEAHAFWTNECLHCLAVGWLPVFAVLSFLFVWKSRK